ncbi:MAG: OmpA family protein [Pseudomonadota bacterium]
MRLSSFVPLVLAFGGAAGGAILAAGAAVSGLEQNSESEVDFELNLRGHEWASVQADGLQVVLSGEAPTEADRFRALAVAGSVVDAARVIDDMSVTESQQLTAPRFSIEMLRNDAGVSLIGLVPATMNREAFVNTIRRAAEGASVTDLLESADYAEPDGWGAALDYALDAVSELERSKISVSADRVDITATATDAREQARLQTELSRAAPETLTATVSISAPRPVITPFTLRFVVDGDGAKFDSCSADTQEALDEILAGAVAVGFEGKSDCRIGLGTPTTRWSEAAVAGIAAVDALGGGSVTFADTKVTLIAAMGTDQAVFDSASADLEASLPDLFSLAAVLPEPEIETDEGPPEFSATLSPEGQVQMRGHVGDELAVSAVETYASSRFGAGAAYLATEPHSDLPNGWSLRALAGLAALAELNYGSVTVASDTLSVRGETGDQEARTRIAQTLSEELGEGQAYSISVAYVEALDPLANIPTVEECLAQIVNLNAESKLTFEPGSADLDADSLETAKAIATVLKECPEFEFVVEGHTDSQGRESMNLSLSQQRAEAVVTVLRNQRLAWGGIYPQGFGETEPIADNGTEDGREANRRIEFRLFSADEESLGEGVEAATGEVSSDAATEDAEEETSEGTGE